MTSKATNSQTIAKIYKSRKIMLESSRTQRL